MAVGALEYLYTPSDDVVADLRYLVDVLGGTLAFAIDDGGTRVAMVEFGPPPAILVTDHLAGDRPIHMFRVADLRATARELEGRGWTRGRSVELPPGPAITFATPGGLRMAIFEASRPFVVDGFRGRRDFG